MNESISRAQACGAALTAQRRGPTSVFRKTKFPIKLFLNRLVRTKPDFLTESPVYQISRASNLPLGIWYQHEDKTHDFGSANGQIYSFHRCRQLRLSQLDCTIKGSHLVGTPVQYPVPSYYFHTPGHTTGDAPRSYTYTQAKVAACRLPPLHTNGRLARTTTPCSLPSSRLRRGTLRRSGS